MRRTLWYTLFLLVLVPGFLLAQSGKIRGTVVDMKTKEPLVGANITVEGTNMGASTDVDGAFLIINVPAGTYQLKASYVGYKAITVTNVRVNLDLTSEVKFDLPSEDVQVQTVEIVAERPLINKTATGAVRVIDSDFFAKLPNRGINAAIVLQPGVVESGGNIYIRGGRPDETGFSLNGVTITNIFDGGRAVTITAEALEQVQVLTGGYTAEFGGAAAGLVRSELRTGGEKWKIAALYETDKYTGLGTKSLGGYSYGYQDVTVTAGGPLGLNNLRFFGSLQYTATGDPAIRAWDGYNFLGVRMAPTYTSVHPTNALSDTMNLIARPGNTMGGDDKRTTLTGTLSYALSKFQLRVGGSYSANTGVGTTTTANLFNQSRLGAYDNSNGFANAKATFFITPTTYLEGSFNYYFTNTLGYDQAFGEDASAIRYYGDSSANAMHGYTIRANGRNFDPYQIVLGTGESGIGELPSFNQPGTQIAGYLKTKQSGLGGRLDFTSQVSKSVEVKVGGEYTEYTYRRFDPASELLWARDFNDTTVNTADKSPAGALARRLRSYGPNNVGYDVFGNEIDNNTTSGSALLDLGARHPAFGGAYVQSKVELQDIILNIGLRYDYISADVVQWKDPAKLSFVDSLGAINVSNLETTTAKSYVSPRIGFSFPVTDRTVFYSQFGRFIQQPRFAETYRGAALFYNIIKGGFFYQNPIGFGIQPEQTTQYGIGFQQQIGENASFDVSAFYKDIQDQVQYVNITPEAGATQSSYYSYQNGDFATTKGLEFKFTLRRTERLQAQVNYTLSDARGTGSTPNAMAGPLGSPLGGGVFVPKYVVPLNFNQTHRGSIMLDYRFAKNDGGAILQQMGLNVLVQFNSGSNFTRLEYNSQQNATDPRFRTPVEEIGASTTPWFFELDARLDKTFNVGPVDLNVYIYVINLLNANNAANVFLRTGDPADDGWFGIPEGRARAASFGSDAALYQQMYRTFTDGNNSGNFGTPRQIRFGVRLEY